MENQNNQQEQMTNPCLYSDFMDVTINYDNMSLVIFLKGTGHLSPLGNIKMSPQTAKELSKTLKAAIKQYESIYGRINEFNDKAREREQEARKEALIKKDAAINTEIQELQEKLAKKREERDLLAKELQGSE